MLLDPGHDQRKPAVFLAVPHGVADADREEHEDCEVQATIQDIVGVWRLPPGVLHEPLHHRAIEILRLVRLGETEEDIHADQIRDMTDLYVDVNEGRLLLDAAVAFYEFIVPLAAFESL